MKINKRFVVMAMGSTLALTMTVGAFADSLIINVSESDRTVTLYNYANGETIYSAEINEAAQGTICHGLRVQPSGYVDGYTIAQIENDSPRTVYIFTGPSCDGYAHVAGPGQYTQLDNSTNTSHNVLVKSYYFR
jgi:hypothetical protein